MVFAASGKSVVGFGYLVQKKKTFSFKILFQIYADISNVFIPVQENKQHFLKAPLFFY